MEQRPPSAAPKVAQTPTADTVDRMPKSEAEWRAFALLSPAERSAVYLRSIRSMVMFFTVLVVVGLVLGFLTAFGVMSASN